MTQVRAAKIAAEELRRVADFLTVLRACAARAALGVNFIPGTPNLHRVVEMSALSAALAAAFPELESTPALALPLARSDFLPWPERGWHTRAPPAGGAAVQALESTQAALRRIQDIQFGRGAAAGCRMVGVIRMMPTTPGPLHGAGIFGASLSLSNLSCGLRVGPRSMAWI